MSGVTVDSFNTSPQQEQLWLNEPDGPSGRLQAVIECSGPLDEARLRRALEQLVARHEALRTTFLHQAGLRVPLQAINDQLDPTWRTLELGADARAVTNEFDDALRRELAEPFDFERGPLVRALLVARAADQHALVLTASDLIVDTSSVAVLPRELVHHYGGAEALVEDPLQYADYAEWKRELLASEDGGANSAREFWSRLPVAATPSLPFAGENTAAFVPEEIAVPVDPELDAAIEAGAARYGAAPSVFVQAAWHALLGRVSGEPDVTVGVMGPLRRQTDLEGAVGAFGWPVPISTPVADAVTFAEVLARVGQANDQAADSEGYAPLDVSVGLQIGFLAPEPYQGRAGDLGLSLERVAIAGSHFRLWLTYLSIGAGARLSVCFDPDYLDRDSVQRLARELEMLIRGAAADAGAAIGQLELLDGEERERLLVDFNATSAPIPTPCVHELISAQAVAAPERPAVIDERGSISYAELEGRANQLAQRLRRAGVRADRAVGLCTDRSIDMVVGLLGIMKAGGAYLPLHHEHPPARLGHQLSTAGATVIVTQEPLLAQLPDFAGQVICLDRDRAELDREPSSAPDVEVAHENLVYVIYTSGSTGTPKGVGVTHGNLVNYATAIAHRLGADSEPLAFGLVTSISTDLGNTSVFGSLCSGGTLVLISPEAAADGAALARQLERTPIDVLKITPSHVASLLATGDPHVLPRRWLVLGGERATWDVITRIRELSDCRILNHYGPTEATVGCCTFVVGDGPGPYRPATVPIGRPMANATAYVLDPLMRPAPLGVSGRLFIGGAGVAREYLGRPDLTAERFVPDPFAGAARCYDTGDLARWLPDGTLEFLGRDDEQIKVRGYRVEPAEIETALRSHPAVSDAVIVAQPTASGDVRLVAYCATTGTVSRDDLRTHLGEWLPEFMIPSLIATLDVLPRTPSGKVDRLSLPDPETLMGQAASAYVAPRTPIEESVAAMWAETLGVERVGVTEDFFEIGGHSLLATQVVAQVRSGFAVDLPLHSLFTCPTIETLAAEIMRMMGESEQDDTAALLAELEGLSDEDAERLLAGEGNHADPG